MKSSVPTYALYGEHGKNLVPESLHCESIPQRSRLYDWEIKLHRHDLFVQILYIRSGTAAIQFEDRRFEAHGPCALFVPALHAHGFHFSEDIDGAVITIVTQQMESLLTRHADLLVPFQAPSFIPFETEEAAYRPFSQAVELLLAEYAESHPWRLSLLESLLGTVLVLMARKISTLAHYEPGRRSSRGVMHLHRFKALLNRSFREQRDISYYAQRLGITPTQLNRICRDELGLSALGVINDRLLTEARRDLAYSSLSVKEIALTLGFSDPSYFSRFFTKHAGTSPSEFRTMVRDQFDRERISPPTGA
ncbi:MAG: helix-turn-helix domain-containing protein [Pigmentiphaga sp.]|uniref:helix-turn-helix domain-containing protein n=1 Tax=Pigmentiphaga sp. TaxID=1977564 RepID=UPI0029BEACE6|nr:helix-turn-helix domain-containing protein [Pigmentiphaga sp.]MDX3906636.1 helix-turn-helix domain-containing protein [Pigmentiphaga sp.]